MAPIHDHDWSYGGTSREKVSQPLADCGIHIGPIPKPDFAKVINSLRSLGASLVRDMRDLGVDIVLVNVDSDVREDQVKLLDQNFNDKKQPADLTPYLLNRFCRLVKGSDPGSNQRKHQRRIVLDYRWVASCARQRAFLGKSHDYDGKEIMGFLPGPLADWALAPKHLQRSLPGSKTAPQHSQTANAPRAGRDGIPGSTRNNFVPQRHMPTEKLASKTAERSIEPVSVPAPQASAEPRKISSESETRLKPDITQQLLALPPITSSSSPSNDPKEEGKSRPHIVPAPSDQITQRLSPKQSSSTALQLERASQNAAPEVNGTHKRLGTAAETLPPPTPCDSVQVHIPQKRSRPSSPAYCERSVKTRHQNETNGEKAGIFTAPWGLPIGFHVIGDQFDVDMLALLLEKDGGTICELESASFIIMRIVPGKPMNQEQVRVCESLRRSQAAVSYTWIQESMRQGKRLELQPYRLDKARD